mmetsp:Transcript_8622/g.9800  ORF Transcript_8622/g.9800 Transcript_8622/m.9800 type:complete len:210 (-) Transcript_8622:21-650(-)
MLPLCSSPRHPRGRLSIVQPRVVKPRQIRCGLRAHDAHVGASKVDPFSVTTRLREVLRPASIGHFVGHDLDQLKCAAGIGIGAVDVRNHDIHVMPFSLARGVWVVEHRSIGVVRDKIQQHMLVVVVVRPDGNRNSVRGPLMVDRFSEFHCLAPRPHCCKLAVPFVPQSFAAGVLLLEPKPAVLSRLWPHPHHVCLCAYQRRQCHEQLHL